jgi:hypothetical protein
VALSCRSPQGGWLGTGKSLSFVRPHSCRPFSLVASRVKTLMKQLDRLLFEQGGDCFFCKLPLAKEDASIEHLLAQANGGTSAEENIVACCKAVNSLLGNKPLKEKLAIVLRQKNGFRCPARPVATAPSKSVPTASSADLSAAPKLAPKRTAVAPTKSPSITPISSVGIVALTKSPPVAANVKTVARAVVCPTCQSSVPSAVGQVDYVCPHCRGAFRY